MSGSERSEKSERKQEQMHSLPPTPESHPLDEYSDAPSASSTNSRRKYQRGGRKQSTSTRESRKSRIGPIAEREVPDEDEQYDQAERELIQDEPDEPIGEDEEVDDPEEGYYEEEAEEEEQSPELPQPSHRENVASPKNETLCSNCAAKTKQKQPAPQQKASSPFETGIKAFNLKRAERSGGRPINVRATPSSSSKKSTKSAKKPTKAKKKSRKPEEEEEGESDDSFEEQKQKPMSIRLDLNLMVEIFLKAKIKGDVTITFLE